jgi:hypothetical protein
MKKSCPCPKAMKHRLQLFRHDAPEIGSDGTWLPGARELWVRVCL